MNNRLRLLVLLLLPAFTMISCSGGAGTNDSSHSSITGIPVSNPVPGPTTSSSTASNSSAMTTSVAVDDSLGAIISIANGVTATFPATSLTGNAKVTLSILPDLQLSGSSPSGDDLKGGVSFEVAYSNAAVASTVAKSRSLIIMPPIIDPANAIEFEIPGPTDSTIDDNTLPFATMTIQGSVFPMAFPVKLSVNPGLYHVALPTIARYPMNPALPKQLKGTISWLRIRTSTSTPTCSNQYGVRYFNPFTGVWSNTPYRAEYYGNSTNYRTLLVVHGILSCAEASFSPSMLAELGMNGNYTNIIAYNYNWFQKPDKIIPDMATAINNLHLSNFDIAAHSYGGVVTMALVPKLARPESLENVIFYGSPLNGAVTSDPRQLETAIAFGYINPTIAAIPVGLKFVDSTINDWATIYDPANLQLNSIRGGFQLSAPSRVIKVAGNVPFATNSAVRLAYENLVKWVSGRVLLPAFDGIVPVDSALDPSIVGRTLSNRSYGAVSKTTIVGPVELSHVQIVNDTHINDAVSKGIGYAFPLSYFPFSPIGPLVLKSVVDPQFGAGESPTGFGLKGIGSTVTSAFAPYGGVASELALNEINTAKYTHSSTASLFADSITPWTVSLIATTATPPKDGSDNYGFSAHKNNDPSQPVVDSWGLYFGIQPDCYSCTNVSPMSSSIQAYQSFLKDFSLRGTLIHR